MVFLMAHELAQLCDLKIVDPGIYDGSGPGNWYREDGRVNPKNPVKWLDHERVLSIVHEHRADFVIVNSGGLSLDPETIRLLRKEQVTCIGISLSDPDVFPYHGRIYAHLYDLYYTNSAFSLENQYGKSGTGSHDVHIHHLPFAASPRLHRPLPEVEKKFDLVIVGHARPDRIKIVEALERRFSVGLFGKGWGSGILPVHGEDHVRAINSGRMYLSFSQTGAGYTNVKVGIFEAAACRTLLISQVFPEMEQYFRYGLELAGYLRASELPQIISWYREKEHLRAWMAQNSYQRCLAEHTWQSRWQRVLDDIVHSRN